MLIGFSFEVHVPNNRSPGNTLQSLHAILWCCNQYSMAKVKLKMSRNFTSLSFPLSFPILPPLTLNTATGSGAEL